MGFKFILIILFSIVFNVLLFGQQSNLTPCIKDGNHCFCDSTGKIILHGKWLYVSKFDHGFAFVRDKKRAGYIDTTGEFECNCSYKWMGKFHNGYTWASDETDNIYIINKACKVKFSKAHNGGEEGAAFFDSIIVIYALNQGDCGNIGNSYGAIDYKFNVIIPFDYSSIIKSSSERYYIVGRSVEKKDKEDCFEFWGIFDIVTKSEAVACKYEGTTTGTFNSDMSKSEYTFTFDDVFLKKMEKLHITLPPTDEISDQINGIFKW